MGPFELMDLVGIDVGFEVSKSFYEQSFHEPRWRPSPIQARMVQAGRLGRKSGRGYYDYAAGPGSTATTDPSRRRPAAAGGSRSRATAAWPRSCGVLAADAGYEVTPRRRRNGEMPELLVDALGRPDRRRRRSPRSSGAATTTCILCVDGSLAELDVGGGAVGFHALPPLDDSQLVELTRSVLHERRRRPARSSPSSARSASTSSGSATRPAWCWAGSSASSSTRPASRSPRASARPRTSTSRCGWATTTRAARSSGRT